MLPEQLGQSNFHYVKYVVVQVPLNQIINKSLFKHCYRKWAVFAREVATFIMKQTRAATDKHQAMPIRSKFPVHIFFYCTGHRAVFLCVPPEPLYNPDAKAATVLHDLWGQFAVMDQAHFVRLCKTYHLRLISKTHHLLTPIWLFNPQKLVYRFIVHIDLVGAFVALILLLCQVLFLKGRLL